MHLNTLLHAVITHGKAGKCCLLLYKRKNEGKSEPFNAHFWDVTQREVCAMLLLLLNAASFRQRPFALNAG